MANTPSDLEKVFDPLFGHKFPNVGVILGVLGCRRRGGVVQGDGQPFRVLDPVDAEAVENFGDGGRVVVAQGHVRRGVDDLAGLYAGQSGIFG